MRRAGDRSMLEPTERSAMHLRSIAPMLACVMLVGLSACAVDPASTEVLPTDARTLVDVDRAAREAGAVVAEFLEDRSKSATFVWTGPDRGTGAPAGGGFVEAGGSFRFDWTSEDGKLRSSTWSIEGGPAFECYHDTEFCSPADAGSGSLRLVLTGTGGPLGEPSMSGPLFVFGQDVPEAGVSGGTGTHRVEFVTDGSRVVRVVLVSRAEDGTPRRDTFTLLSVEYDTPENDAPWVLPYPTGDA